MIKKYRIDILAVQETKWIGSGISEMKSHTILRSGGESNKHKLGVAFIVDRKIKKKVLDFKPINERICYLRLKTKFFNLSIINAHAETEDKDEITKESFYQILERVFENAPSNDIKIILGDLNAKVGREHAYRRVTGSHSLHEESNDNGRRVIDFATTRNLVISSTCFPRRDIHKWTWRSPDGRTHNQIDHVLISKRGASNVVNVRTYRGANCESDHELVRMRYRARIAQCRHDKYNNPTKLYTKKFEQQEMVSKYQRKLAEELQKCNKDSDTIRFQDRENLNEDGGKSAIEEEWRQLKRVILETGESVLGQRPRNGDNEWFDQKCREMIEKRNALRMGYIERPTRAKRILYENARREANRTVRSKKRAYLNAILLKAEQDFKEDNTREAYKGINFFKKGYSPRTTICRSSDGEMLTEEKAILDRWRCYFDQLLNPNRTRDSAPTDCGTTQEDDIEAVPPPTLEEVAKAIRKLKNNKAPGIDNLPGELFKHGGEALALVMHRLIESIWRTEALPEEWQVSIIHPIHKKGDRLKCENYRGISLLSTAYKIFTNILKERLEPFAEEALGEYQAGFRKGRSTIDQLHVVRQIAEKFWEFDIPLYQLFVDFKQAYDSIDRDELAHGLRDLGIPQKLIRLIQATMSDTKGQVRINGGFSDTFEISQGLKQGDGLAPMLFNLALERAIRDARMEVKSTLLHRTTQLIGYADDLNIAGRNLATIKKTFLRLEESSGKIGLRINEEKTKVMVQSRHKRDYIGQNMECGRFNFETVEEFTYLGSRLTNNNDESAEIQKRLTTANRTYFSLLPVLRARNVHRKTKLRLYKTLIRAVLTYGCETWSMTASAAEGLDGFERKILRRIFGPVCEGGLWRARSNHGIYQLYGEPRLSMHIRMMRLRWAGHVQRMPKERAPKMLLSGQPGGRRPVGKPRLRWEDAVDRDARGILGVRNWRSASGDRVAWRRRIEEARARLGL